jgi:hypothetical protein
VGAGVAAGAAAAGVEAGAGVEGASAGDGAGLQAGSIASVAAASGKRMAAERGNFFIGVRDTRCAGMFIECEFKNEESRTVESENPGSDIHTLRNFC